MVETTPHFNEMESFSRIFSLAIEKIQNFKIFWQVAIIWKSDSLQIWYSDEVGHQNEVFLKIQILWIYNEFSQV